MYLRATILAFAAILVAAFAVRAQASPASVPEKAPPQVEPQLQLAALMAPVRWPNGRYGTKAMTPVLDLGNEGVVTSVCWMVPRIRDAVIVALYQEPVLGIGRGKFDLAAVAVRLTRAVNTALGGPLVNKVNLVPGTQPAMVSARFAEAIRCGKRVAKKRSH